MKVAVFIDNAIDTNLLDNIKQYFAKQYKNCSVFLSNLHMMQTSVDDIAVVNRYHLKWNNNKGSLLFLTLQDASLYSSHYNLCEKFLLITKEEIKNLTKEIVDNCNILIKGKNNQIRKAKNAELQSNVRH